MNEYKIKSTVLSVNSLNCSYPLVEALNIKPNDFYKDTFKEFYTLADRPFVIDDAGKNYVLSSMEDVLSAIKLGQEEMEVFIVEGLEGLSLIRFILHKTQTRRKSASGIINAIEFLTEYFERNQEAKKWAKSFEGDTKALWAKLLGSGETSIQDYQTIHEFAPSLIADIDAGFISKNQALQAARKIREDLKNNISISDIDMPSVEITEFDKNEPAPTGEDTAKLLIEGGKQKSTTEESRQFSLENVEIILRFDKNGKLSIVLNGIEEEIKELNESRGKNENFFHCELSTKCEIHFGITGMKEFLAKLEMGHQ